MRIATWNVNSIRVRVDAVLAWLEKERPDVLCMQEVKIEEHAFPRERFEAAGYRGPVYGQKTYNGVAILSRGELSDVVPGFADGAEEDPHRRVLRATFDGVRIVNGYFPQGEDVGTEKYAYKLRFYERMRNALATQEKASAPMAVVGDFNVAPADRDVHDPKRWAGKIHCSEPERAALAALGAWGLEDTFRRHRAEGGHFSWWDYRLAAFQRGWGLRIDHVLATPPLASRSNDCRIDVEPRKAERPSDHAPVFAEFT